MAMQPDPSPVGAHLYCTIMMEAVEAIAQAHNLGAEAALLAKTDDSNWPVELRASAGMYSRYSFHSSCIAFETGANALIAQLPGASTSLIDEFDRLSTITKYELFALVRGTPLNRGEDHFAKMLHIVRLRNSFVHPRRESIPLVEDVNGGYRVEERIIGNRTYPRALDFLELHHGVRIVGDILRFISWVLFDTCRFSVDEGADILNYGYRSHTGTIYFAHEELGFDVRSFGIDSLP